jgi:hypothetical protein
MNLRAATMVLRPRSVSEVLDLACRFATGPAMGLFAKLTALVLVPGYVLALVAHYVAGWDWWAVWLMAFCYTVLAEGVFTVTASRMLFAEEVTVRQVMKVFGSRLSSFAFGMLIKVIALAAGTIAFFVPGIFVWMRSCFMTEASLLEGVGATGAWTRSGRLSTTGSSPAFALLLTLLLARLAVVVAAELLGLAIVGDVLQLGEPFGSVWKDGGSPFALAGLFLTAPYVASARFLQYIDVRTRNDGWDIQVRFMGIVAREAGPLPHGVAV